MADAILRFREDLGRTVRPGYVVHPGEAKLPLAPDVMAMPFETL